MQPEEEKKIDIPQQIEEVKQELLDYPIDAAGALSKKKKKKSKPPRKERQSYFEMKFAPYIEQLKVASIVTTMPKAVMSSQSMDLNQLRR